MSVFKHAQSYSNLCPLFLSSRYVDFHLQDQPIFCTFFNGRVLCKKELQRFLNIFFNMLFCICTNQIGRFFFLETCQWKEKAVPFTCNMTSMDSGSNSERKKFEKKTWSQFSARNIYLQNAYLFTTRALPRSRPRWKTNAWSFLQRRLPSTWRSKHAKWQKVQSESSSFMQVKLISSATKPRQTYRRITSIVLLVDVWLNIIWKNAAQTKGINFRTCCLSNQTGLCCWTVHSSKWIRWSQSSTRWCWASRIENTSLTRNQKWQCKVQSCEHNEHKSEGTLTSSDCGQHISPE